ncbi:MAG: hypothetical protein K2N50_06280 [Clostridia bacterium]|nr:hypothetical protein [Clostridia bacterium]
MKIKILLRFYFSAGSLNDALDGLITHLAVTSGVDIYGGGAAYAARISDIVEAKRKLSCLWGRLDGILQKMTERDRQTLKRYAALRTGVNGGEKKEIHRAAVKFVRRAGGLLTGGEELYKVVCAYRCLISPAPD